MTDLQIIRQLRREHADLKLVVSCIVNAVDRKADPLAAELFNTAVAAGRGMVQP